jgi:hypothetical protein
MASNKKIEGRPNIFLEMDSLQKTQVFQITEPETKTRVSSFKDLVVLEFP